MLQTPRSSATVQLKVQGRSAWSPALPCQQLFSFYIHPPPSFGPYPAASVFHGREVSPGDRILVRTLVQPCTPIAKHRSLIQSCLERLACSESEFHKLAAPNISAALQKCAHWGSDVFEGSRD